MKILICSLQVTVGSSKGHLHPAIEIALALKQRGHEIAILPLPSPLSDADQLQLQHCQIPWLQPPTLAKNILLSAAELAQFAKHEATTHKAYESFLISPLPFLFADVVNLIRNFAPDVVVYDLLVYAAPLAARLLSIPEIGFCAGLKLIAPAELTQVYQTTFAKISPRIFAFLKTIHLDARFHGLELLSNHFQLVFAPQEIKSTFNINMVDTVKLVGALPMSQSRTAYQLCHVPKNAVLLSFGSVYDPANYPELTRCIEAITHELQLPLLMVSQHWISSYSHVSVVRYLSLPMLLNKIAILIHHGGANTFSEALACGTKQILIPLATDQPIQANFLNQAKIGFAIPPTELTEENLYHAMTTLLDAQSNVHEARAAFQKIYARGDGGNNAADLIETVARK